MCNIKERVKTWYSHFQYGSPSQKLKAKAVLYHNVAFLLKLCNAMILVVYLTSIRFSFSSTTILHLVAVESSSTYLLKIFAGLLLYLVVHNLLIDAFHQTGTKYYLKYLEMRIDAAE